MVSIKRLMGAAVGTLALLTGGLATAPGASASVGDVNCLNSQFSGGTTYETSSSTLCVKSYSNYNGSGQSGYRVWFNNRTSNTLHLDFNLECIGGARYGDLGDFYLPPGYAGSYFFSVGLKYGCAGMAYDYGNYFYSKTGYHWINTLWIYYP
jgi:hypothetical protein